LATELSGRRVKAPAACASMEVHRQFTASTSRARVASASLERGAAEEAEAEAEEAAAVEPPTPTPTPLRVAKELLTALY